MRELVHVVQTLVQRLDANALLASEAPADPLSPEDAIRAAISQAGEENGGEGMQLLSQAGVLGLGWRSSTRDVETDDAENSD